MGVTDSIKEGYYSLEDKWYKFVDSVSEKVPAFGSFVDFVEEKGVPSFPAFILLLFIILLLLFFVLNGGIGFTSTVSLSVVNEDGDFIPNTKIIVLKDGEQIKTFNSDSMGKINFVLPNGTYKLEINKENYSPRTKTINVSADHSEKIILSKISNIVTRTVYLKTANGDLVTGRGIVFYKCKNPSSFETKDTTYSNGGFNAELDSECTEVEVISIENYSLLTPFASFSGDGAVMVEQIESSTGNASIIISVANSTETVPAGIKVKLVPTDGTVPIETLTNATNAVVFEGVSAKTYYVIVQDLTGEYQTYNGSILDETKLITKGETTVFEVTLTKTPSTEINLLIRDEASGDFVKGAEVKITSLQNTEEYQSKITGATGQITFKVSQGTEFNLTVDHPDYLVGEVNKIIAGEEKTISLVKADSMNSSSLLVKVIDSKKEPVENARIILKTLDVTQPIVGEKISNTSGEAEFSGLIVGKTYMVVVSKENFGAVNSQSIQVSPRTQKILEVPFDITEKIVNIRVMNQQNNPVSGASVKAINYFTDEQMGLLQTTGVDGLVNHSIRADKKIYFVIEANGYSKYFTAAEYVFNLFDKKVVLLPNTTQLKASIIGIYSEWEDEIGVSEANTTLSEGTYIIKSVVQVPRGNYNEVGLHLRTGKETQNLTNLVEEDGLFLSNPRTSGLTTMGTTYSPLDGYDVDSKNIISSGNAKWINSTWKNPVEGTYELETDITITENNPNIPLNLFYRAWAKGGTTTRYPSGVFSGNELYAPANVKFLSSGGTSFCEGSFCKSITLQALSGSEAKKKIFVTDLVELKKDVEYVLTIDLVNYSGRTITNAVLSVEENSIDVNGLIINGLESTKKEVEIGTIGVDSPTKIEMIIKPISAGTSNIKTIINSLTQNEFESNLTINVKPNKKFVLEMIPKVIIPYVENTIYFEATDENNPLSGVIINIKNKNIVIGNITTNGEGIAQYELAAPRAGDEITFTATKEGYDKIILTKKIDKGILTLVPPRIEETIKIGETKAIETQVIIENNTTKTIKLISAQINGEIKNYLETKFTNQINGTIIEQGKDQNYFLQIKLNNNAERIMEPKEVTGTIVLNTEVSGANQSFLNEIPIKIRLTFPGMLDNGKCFQVTPTTIDFVTSTTEQTQLITLTNNCSAEGTMINLRNLEAKLSEQSKFGTITLIGEGINGQLSESFTQIGDYLEKNEETEMVLRFVPTTIVDSGEQNLSITFNAKNLLDDGSTEKVETKTNLDLTMNNLANCIIIEKPVGGITLNVAPWNQGYGRLMGSDFAPNLDAYQGFSRSAPYNLPYMNGMGMMGYQNQFLQGGAYGVGMGYGTGMNLGYDPYNSLGGTGLYNPITMGQGQLVGQNMSYGQSAFNIVNNCASDVEISLNVDPRLMVTENKFTVDAGSNNVIEVQSGYVLGKYNIKVDSRIAGTKEPLKKVGEINVIVQRLGDIDRDCIKTNVTEISLNSFIMRPKTYSVYNYCYDSGVQLARGVVASINCSAPTGAGIGGLPYLQVGMEPFYGPNYPLNSAYPNYNTYSSFGGVCGIGQCSLINGTNIRHRNLIEGEMGSIEVVDFDVIPNPNYIAQRRLFNNQYGTAGLFQNMGDVRQWATESDARTNVYGNLNINYTNAFGAQECMEFPITIKDFWRIGESIDSALNWGDPLARPIDCQRAGALDVISYWENRNTNKKGVVPETEFTGNNKNIYIYISDPSALRIGPMPNTISQYYPQAINPMYDYGYFQQQYHYQQNPLQQTPLQQTTLKTASDDAKANCGLTDSIKVLTKLDREQTGGASVIVEATHSGSLFKNSYGPNLMVQVDRSTMTANCVKLEVPIKAKVTRAITMESQELTWNLRILFTKPGYEYKGLENECVSVKELDSLPTDCIDKLRNTLANEGITKADDSRLVGVVNKFLEENKLCAPYVNLEIAKQLLSSGQVEASKCNEDLEEYGFNLISQVELSGYNKSDLVDCTKYFCNGEMLSMFLLYRFGEIKEKVRVLSSKGEAIDLITLYDASGKEKVNSCKEPHYEFYTKENGGLVTTTYTISKELFSDKIDSINSLGEAAIPDMISVIERIQNRENLLLEMDYDKNYDGQYVDLKMTKVGTKTYLPLNSYLELLRALSIEEAGGNSDCSIDGKICSVSYCGYPATLDPNAFFNSIIRAHLVKGVIKKEHKEMNPKDIELIYAQNPRLNDIHKLAKFDSSLINEGVNGSLHLTKINNLESSQNKKELFTLPTNLEGLRLNYNKNSLDIGKYSIELNYDLENTTNTINVSVGNKEEIKEATKLNENVFLLTGFDFTPSTNQNALNEITNGVLLKANETGVGGVFYKRIPLLINATLHGGETQLIYSPIENTLTKPNNLINWFNSNGTELGADNISGTNYVINVKQQSTPQIIKGIYYYPESGTIGFKATQIGGLINTKTNVLVNYSFEKNLPIKLESDLAIQSMEISEKASKMNLKDVIELIKQNKACVKLNKVIWNEKDLLNMN